MKKWFLFIIVGLFFMPSAYSRNFEDAAVSSGNESVQKIENPTGLLNDENYKIKGRVEYNEDGVLFLDKDDDVDTVYLKISSPMKVNKKSVLSEKNILTKIEDLRCKKYIVVDEYLITPSIGNLEYRDGPFSYGVTFDTDIDTAQLEYRTKFFAKYENKRFSLMTAVGKDEYTSTGRQMDSIYFSPELKLGKGFSVAGVVKANPEYGRCRNDIMLRYKPKIRGDVNKLQFEAGLSQMSYFHEGLQDYQFSISTKYRF